MDAIQYIKYIKAKLGPINWGSCIHASALTAVAKIRPIECQIQQDVPIRSLSFSPVDGRPHPVSGQDPWLYHPELK